MSPETRPSQYRIVWLPVLKGVLMRHFHAVSLASAILVFLLSGVNAQQVQAPQTPRLTDVYHVHFTKAVPGQAAGLAQNLTTQDPKAPMPGHLMLLRHQQGDDWDYVQIEHLGTKAM